MGTSTFECISYPPRLQNKLGRTYPKHGNEEAPSLIALPQRLGPYCIPRSHRIPRVAVNLRWGPCQVVIGQYLLMSQSNDCVPTSDTLVHLSSLNMPAMRPQNRLIGKLVDSRLTPEFLPDSGAHWERRGCSYATEGKAFIAKTVHVCARRWRS